MRRRDDSTQPEFWSSRYSTGKTPWDFQGVPKALLEFLARTGRRRNHTVLIPGCGSGYEIAAFAAAGFDVVAIDFSAAAIRRARRVLGRRLASRIVLADFFEYNFGKQFELAYERTFLCALPPRLWRRYSTRLARLVRPGGRLVGTYWLGRAADGPPFPISEKRLAALFDQKFNLVRSVRVKDSLPLFGDGERWQERRRRKDG